jgi:hypothetical protein
MYESKEYGLLERREYEKEFGSPLNCRPACAYCGLTAKQTHGRFKGGEEVANGVESEVFEDGRHKYSEERWLLDLVRWLEIIYWAVQVQYKCMYIRR